MALVDILVKGPIVKKAVQPIEIKVLNKEADQANPGNVAPHES